MKPIPFIRPSTMGKRDTCEDGDPSSTVSGLRRHVVLDDDAHVLMNTEAMFQALGAEAIATVSPMDALGSPD
jgi:hypothetical protein